MEQVDGNVVAGRVVVEAAEDEAGEAVVKTELTDQLSDSRDVETRGPVTVSPLQTNWMGPR
jgi:hypothetical protein